MSDKMRWRYGDTNPVVAQVPESVEVCVGDLVFQRGDEVLPAQLADEAEEFFDNFLGVATQRSEKGSADGLRVATTGVFEFVCEPATWRLGDWVACRLLRNQEVVTTRERRFTVGRVARREPTATNCVLVDIVSRVMRGGV